MAEHSIAVDVVGELARDVDIHQPLRDLIAEDFCVGKSNKLVLANRAIVRFEKISNVTEWDDADSRRVV